MDGSAVGSVVQTLLADVVQPVLEVGAIALAALLARLAQKYLGVRVSADQQSRIEDATKLGAQAAYGLLAKGGLQVGDVLAQQAAIAHGTQIAVSQLRPILQAAGITDDTVRTLVESRLGGLLAVDPTVSVSAPATPAADPAPAPVPAPVPVLTVGEQPASAVRVLVSANGAGGPSTPLPPPAPPARDPPRETGPV